MKGIVYGATLKRSIEKLQDIVEDYKRIGINPVSIKSSTNNIYIKFDNGDYWQTCRAYDSARGHCCNIAYIDYEISKDLVETVIKPTAKAFPYQGYRYY